MHPCPGNWVAIGLADVHYARVAQALSTGIKCWHRSISIVVYLRTPILHVYYLISPVGCGEAAGSNIAFRE